MPDQKIFCNAPWYELHIYWDGSLGFCCQESHKIHDDDEKYNVKNMSIREWMDSLPMRRARLMMFGSSRNTVCYKCYREEDVSSTSRRIRCNQKSVIFTKSNFEDSYQQSPGYEKFEASRQKFGAYSGMPIDLHIDLGNFCNLTCKMCGPQASSSIAVQQIKWGMEQSRRFVGTDWTGDDAVWNRVLDELSGIKSLKNIHFMGGETLLTSRFEDFIDYMIAHGRTDLHFSFVTNGTSFNVSLLDKLKCFKRVGIEISIESATEHNDYQRQGTHTNIVLGNIDRYLEYCNGSQITLTVRPAISLLTVGTYHTLLDFCLNRGIIVKSLIVVHPRFLDASILPDDIKNLYLQRYENFLHERNLENIDISHDFNESDPNQMQRIIKTQVLRVIQMLKTPRPIDSDILLKNMVEHCRRWDQVGNLDARKLYPEFQKILDEHRY